MKIKELRLSNYKKFIAEKVIKFTNFEGDVNDVTLLVGENGSGKSSVLQAIAALVGGAVKPSFSPAELNWPGFSYDYIQNGRMPVSLKAVISMDKKEVESTKKFAKALSDRNIDRDIVEPYGDSEITLQLDYERNKCVAPRGARSLFQLRGYQYALQLSKFERNYGELFGDVGSIYWYNEQRSSNSFSLAPLNGEDTTKQVIDDVKLREFLVRIYRFHDRLVQEKLQLRPFQRDIYDILHHAYQTVFKSRNFVGPIPKMRPDQIFEVEDFFLYDGRNQYELAEMSAGERAIFPLLVDFANWNINNSIVLIDEIELHLHPPLQQALVRALPKLGKNNQFIITSHSKSVASLFSEDHIIQL